MIQRITRHIILSAIITSSIPAFSQETPSLKADTQATEAAKQEKLLQETPANELAIRPNPSQSLMRTTETITLATWDGGQLTNQELSSTLATRRPAGSPQVSPEMFEKLPRPQQENVIRQLAYEQILLQKAKQSGITADTPAIKKIADEQEEALLNRIYYTEKVTPELEKNTRDTAREYYTENKEKLFTRPAETILRGLHISTYEMITTEEGDSLKGIAERVSGSPDAANLIHDANPPYYLRVPPTQLEDKVLSSPLKPGEVLFVPMNEEAVTSATKLAEELREKLTSGQTIDQVIADTKDADFQVSATEAIKISDAAGYYDEIVQAADQLKETSISQVIKTPAGIDILLAEDRSTTEIIPFDKVEDQLMQRVTSDENQRRQTIEKTREKVLDQLWKKYDVQVNRAAIARPNYLGADPLSSDTMIAKSGDFTYTLDQYLQDLRMTGKDWGQLTENERMEVVKVAPRFINYLIANDARAQGMQNNPEFKEALQGTIDASIVAEYKKRTNEGQVSKVTDDALRAWYNDHLDRYTSPSQVTIRELSKRINMTLPPDAKAEAIEKARQSLNEIRTRIKSEDDFAQLARRESQAISTRSRGGLIGPISDDFRGTAFKNQLLQLKPGDISEPFLYGSEVMIIRLDNRLQPTAQPYETVRNQVKKDYMATEPAKKKANDMKATLDEAHFQLKF